MAGQQELGPAPEALRNRSKKAETNDLETLPSEPSVDVVNDGSEENTKSSRKTYGRTPDGKGMFCFV